MEVLSFNVNGTPQPLDLDYKPYRVRPQQCLPRDRFSELASNGAPSEASTDIGSDSDSGPDCDLYCSSLFNINAAFIRRPRMPRPSTKPTIFGPGNYASVVGSTYVDRIDEHPERNQAHQHNIALNAEDPLIQDAFPDALPQVDARINRQIFSSARTPEKEPNGVRTKERQGPAAQQRVHRQRDHDPYRYSHYSHGFASVVKQVKLSDAKKVPEAIVALDKEWNKLLGTAFTFDDPHEMRDIKRESR